MKNTTKIERIKINEEYTLISGYKQGLVTGRDIYYHFVEKNEMMWTGIVEVSNERDHEEAMQDTVSDIVASELDAEVEVEGQFYIEEFTYDIWCAVVVDGNKLSYELSTIHHERAEEANGVENRLFGNGEDNSEANRATRKTWKGLVNYIEKFSR